MSDGALEGERADAECLERVGVAGRGSFEWWSDKKYRAIVLRCVSPPPNDVVTALQQGAFQFYRRYADLDDVWVRLDNARGRVEMQRIEELLGRDGHGSGRK